MAELKATVSGRLLTRNPENNPSSAATKIPAKPPYRSKTTKINVSEIVTAVLTRGNWTDNRELTNIMVAVRITKRQPNFGNGTNNIEPANAAMPTTTITRLYLSSNGGRFEI